jgi:hypothetical protein
VAARIRQQPNVFQSKIQNRKPKIETRNWPLARSAIGVQSPDDPINQWLDPLVPQLLLFSSLVTRHCSFALAPRLQTR